MSLLSVENVTSGYGKKEVIKGISFSVNHGEVVTVIGSNGAGKSTVLKTIYGLNAIWNDGRVVFDGESISSSHPEVLLQKGIVYIGQKVNTFENLTVLENLKTAGYIYSKTVLEEKVGGILAQFSVLQSIQHKKPTELSGGQRQLVALAMGLLHDPKLILFDEPSAGLDVKRMHEVFGIIEMLKQERGISFLVVEHRVKEISKITDRWIGLKLGEKMYDNENIDEVGLNRVFL
jgi:branched-chain amino acid transport system ATP-binding protein